MTVQGEAALWYHMKFFTTSYILSREHLEGRDRRAQFPQYGLFYNREGVVRRRAEAKCKGETARESRSSNSSGAAASGQLLCTGIHVGRAQRKKERAHEKSLGVCACVCVASKAELKAMCSFLIVASSGGGVSSCRLKQAFLKPGFN